MTPYDPTLELLDAAWRSAPDMASARAILDAIIGIKKIEAEAAVDITPKPDFSDIAPNEGARVVLEAQAEIEAREKNDTGEKKAVEVMREAEELFVFHKKQPGKKSLAPAWAWAVVTASSCSNQEAFMRIANWVKTKGAAKIEDLEKEKVYTYLQFRAEQLGCSNFAV